MTDFIAKRDRAKADRIKADYIDSLVDHVEISFERAELLQSKISQDIKDMEGMTGEKTRHFYNNLLTMPDARYLEIGVWKGSSCCAAMFGNKAKIDLIDDFSGFGSPKDEFMSNLVKYKDKNDVIFNEVDCFKIDPNLLRHKFNIFLFDGDHSHESQRKGLEYYLPVMEDEFIFIIDDWNWKQVRTGTKQAIRDNNLEVLYMKEIFTNNNDEFNNDAKGWWNGICCVILKK